MRKNHYHEAKKEHINKYKMAHCIGVAEYMRNNATKYDLDPNKMYIVGLLHDIGYLEGRRYHEAIGADFLETELNVLDKEVINAIKYHGTSPNKLNDELLKNFILLLLYEADMQIDTEGHYVGFDGRLKDFEKRYGNNSIAYKTASETVEFVKTQMEYWKVSIRSPKDTTYFDIHSFNKLEDYCDKWSYAEKDSYIEIESWYGKELYEYEMNISPEIPDEYCCRVYINGRYYYFS